MSKALFLHGIRDAQVRPYNLPPAEPGDVMVEVAAVGICGSDLHYYKDGRIGSGQVIREPFVPGHEFGGYLCDDCAPIGLKAGALVSVDPNRSCGHCDWCAEGHTNLCPNVRFIGAPPFNGGMTQRISVPSAQIVAMPEGMTPLDAVMVEPLGIAIHAIDLAKPKLLERVALLGAGPVGLLILQVLKASGAGEILVADPQAHRRQAALSLGAQAAFENAAKIWEATAKQGCSLVIEATNSPDGFADAVRAARIGGRVILVGIPDGDIYTLGAAEARRRGLTVKFSRRMGHVYPRAIALVQSGKVDVASLVSHQIGLDEAPRAFAALAEGAAGYIKVLVDPRKTSS
jgi:L-iditol 2-dehydrogenase